MGVGRPNESRSRNATRRPGCVFRAFFATLPRAYTSTALGKHASDCIEISRSLHCPVGNAIAFAVPAANAPIKAVHHERRRIFGSTSMSWLSPRRRLHPLPADAIALPVRAMQAFHRMIPRKLLDKCAALEAAKKPHNLVGVLRGGWFPNALALGKAGTSVP
jgi:hypothetical protein